MRSFYFDGCSRIADFDWPHHPRSSLVDCSALSRSCFWGYTCEIWYSLASWWQLASLWHLLWLLQAIWTQTHLCMELTSRAVGLGQGLQQLCSGRAIILLFASFPFQLQLSVGKSSSSSFQTCRSSIWKCYIQKFAPASHLWSLRISYSSCKSIWIHDLQASGRLTPNSWWPSTACWDWYEPAWRNGYRGTCQE